MREQWPQKCLKRKRMGVLKILIFFLLGPVPGLGQSQINKKDYSKFKAFGTLHTFESLIFWARKEEIIVNVLRERLSYIKHQKEIILRYKQSYDRSSGKALQTLIEPNLNKVQRGNVIGSSLVLSHLMTDRYANILKAMRALLKSDSYLRNQRQTANELKIRPDNVTDSETDVVKNLLAYVGTLGKIWNKFPNWQDMYMSSISILHIQEAYAFPSQYFRVGLPIDTKYGGELGRRHCAQLGIFALQTFSPYYFYAIEWLETALNIFDEGNDDSFPRNLIESLLHVAIQEVYSSPSRIKNLDVWIRSFVHPVTLLDEERFSGRDAYYEHFKDSTTASGNDSNQFVRFMDLCRGLTFQTNTEKSTLKCYLERTKHPYFILNPVKTEQLSHYPYLVKMYEVLGNETMNKLRTMRGYGSISTVASNDDLAFSLGQRTSAGFIPLSDGTDVFINKKTEMLTGLIISAVDEAVMVSEYVYGRYYGSHEDSFSGDLSTLPHHRPAGNRLATVLYYIQEPDLGGFTPFGQVGTFSGSTVGAAIFWINLFKNGTSRNDVSHAACPVIHGHKIIINRWIGSADNFLTAPCSLNKLD